MNSILKPSDYRAGIYIDFEGEGKKSDGYVPEPHLAGIFQPKNKGKSGIYTSIFFKSNWKPVHNHFYKQASLVDFKEYFTQLGQILNREKRYLIHWSVHEELILKTYLPESIFKIIASRLHNLHPIASRYARRKQTFGENESTRKKTLENFFQALYKKRNPYPPFPLGAAEACRRIDVACRKKKKWRHFSEKQKSYANDLIQYNEGDCRSTWLIAKRVGNFFNH